MRHPKLDYENLGEQLARRNIDIDKLRQQTATFGVAIPSWGVGTGGTRFARFPGGASLATCSTSCKTAA